MIEFLLCAVSLRIFIKLYQTKMVLCSKLTFFFKSLKELLRLVIFDTCYFRDIVNNPALHFLTWICCII